MKYFRIANWDQFQHYKKRTPPWIKLHRETVCGYEFSCLQDASKLHLILLTRLASEHENLLPEDPDWLTRQIGTKAKVDLKPLYKYGFIEDASGALANCTQDACLEREGEREGEREEEREEEAKPPCNPPNGEVWPRQTIREGLPGWWDAAAWSEWITWRKREKRKGVSQSAADKQYHDLKEWADKGYKMRDIVEQSIKNDWQGLFEPRKPPEDKWERLAREAREARINARQ